MHVAIVGTAPSSRFLAPFHDSSVQIWACSPSYDENTGEFCGLPRVDRFYELHNFDGPELQDKLTPDQIAAYKQWLTDLSGEVVLQDHETIEKAVPYPLKEVTSRFGRYLTNSVSYMIAHAILEKATQISVYGVDMAANEDYGAQRPSCERWLGLAQGRGIEVYVPDTSDLLKTRRLYAFEPEGGYTAKVRARKQELSQRLEIARHDVEVHGQAAAACNAAAQEIDNLATLMNGEGTPELLAKMEKRKARLHADMKSALQEQHKSRDGMLAIMGAEEDTKYFEQWG